MEASAVERESVPQSSSVREEAAAQRGAGVLLPLVFLGGTLAMYLAIGYAIYVGISALT